MRNTLVDAHTPSRHARRKPGNIASVWAITFFWLLMGLSGQAQNSAPAALSTSAAPAVATAPRSPNVPTTRLHLFIGRSLVISSPERIRRVSVADPDIADILVLNANQILVNGRASGGVSIVVWDENEQSRTYDVDVTPDLATLSEKLRAAFPNDELQIEASGDALVLSGRAASKEESDRIFSLVSAVAPKTLNLLQVPAKATKGQILLEVKFAEVDRGAMKNLGFNLLSVPGSTTRTLAVTGTQQYGPIQLQQNQSSTSTSGTGSTGGLDQANLTLSDLLNIFIYRPDVNLGATIKALEQKNLLQILAEPNLLTAAGKEADFLAGGEFPVPVVQGGAVGTAPTVTIQFKQFGISLKFTPDLMDDDTIHLKVRPEVSALDYTNAVTVSGFFIPAISTRRVDAEVDLRDGQSFAIAGLVDNRVTDLYNKVPVLSSIPLLGEIFKSQSRNKTKTELLVLVTPHVVMPIPVGSPRPSLHFPSGFLDSAPPAPEKKPSPK
ncbi:MAG TPA: type II and III secretion system protein family protein [Candidatus Limnocylindrales bacterium]|nr:type II and III secretion system protein family protein [Candidatus Limnocylindrales bacterium]